MKLSNIFLTVILAVLAFFAYDKFVKKEDTTEENEGITDGKSSVEPPPPPPNGQGTTTTGGNENLVVRVDPYTGDGAIAIKNRIKAFYASSYWSEIVDKIDFEKYLFNGVDYKSGFRDIIVNQIGILEDFDIPPTQEAKRLISRTQTLIDLEDFEELQKSYPFDEAIKKLDYAADLTSVSNVSFFPPDIKDLIDNKVFGDSGKGDRNKSERYDKYHRDMKNLFSNIKKVSEKLQQVAEVQAIEDLTRAGWSFIGFS